jgi:glycosyltransferase involved in cell wall biosynthesis
VVLFLHNRYRTTGGEERVLEDLMWLVREHLGEPAELLARSSESLSRSTAAGALLRGGLNPADVAGAIRLGGARVVHAHNLQPGFGWRALAAARAAGARVVLHLHQYRLVCAIGVCYTRGAECTRCHGRDTLPGVRLNCRGSLGEALAYGASLALWQRRMVAQADAVVVPSAFARERLRELGAPLPWERVHVLAPVLRALAAPASPRSPDEQAAPDVGSEPPLPGESARLPGARSYALVVSRLAPEKGIDVAIDACRRLELPLLVAGEGPEREALHAHASGGEVRLLGRVDDARLAALRAEAAVAVVPSRSAETFGLAAAEAMAAGLPVAASRVGALPELLEEQALAPAGDSEALAEAIARQLADPGAGHRARERVRAMCAPEIIAGRLAAIYGDRGVSAPGT